MKKKKMSPYVILLFFFFSSRRRHTRWTGDWSSDVCSSDLDDHRAHRERRLAQPVNWLGQPSLAMGAVIVAYVWRTTPFNVLLYHAGLRSRSEERRVGKEGRAGWSPSHDKEKRAA